MMQTFFKMFWYGLKQNIYQTIFTITGLIIGFTTIILLIVYLDNQFNYDSYNNNIDRIYRITTKLKVNPTEQHTADGDALLAPLLKAEYPQIEEVVRFRFLYKSFFKSENNSDYEKNIYYTNKEIFKVFEYKFIEGNAANALAEPRSIVLTKTLKRKYFGDEPALNKTLKAKNDQFKVDELYKVTAVIDDLPENTDLKFDALLSKNLDYPYEMLDETNCYTYVMFKNGYNGSEFKSLLKGFVKKHYKTFLAEVGAPFIDIEFEMQPLKKLHLHNTLVYDTPKANITYLYMLIVVVSLIYTMLITIVIYYQIGISSFRIKDWYIKRVYGCTKREIIISSIIEPLLWLAFTMISSFIIILIIHFCFGNIFSINVNFIEIVTNKWIYINFLIVSLICIISGFICAIYIIKMLRDINNMLQRGRSIYNKIGQLLIISISLILLITTLGVKKQLYYIQNKNLGFSIENTKVLQVPNDTALFERYQAFVRVLKNNENVDNIAIGGMGSQLTSNENLTPLSIVKRKDDILQTFVNVIEIDENYLDLFKIQIKEGRNFDYRIEANKNSIIVNEEYVKRFGLKNPIGETFWQNPNIKIIGVIKNINYKSLYNNIDPLVFSYVKNANNVFIKLKNSDKDSFIDESWNKFFPEYDLRIYSLEDYYSKVYENDKRLSQILNSTSGIVLFMSLVIVLIMSISLLSRKKKEIGIKFVLGANNTHIALELAKKNMQLVLFATIISIPVSIYLFGFIVENFAYRTSLNVWMFVWPIVIISIFIFIAILLAVNILSKLKVVNVIKYNS